MLYRIIKKLKPNSILELGTSFGVSSLYLSEANPKAFITTIEGEKEIHQLAKQNTTSKNIKYICGDINKWINENKNTYDCIIIDANHTYEATIDYYNSLLNNLNKNGFIIFDDIYWSTGMTKAWKEISQKKEVSVSIDLFNFGIIFIRPEQRKEHFTLRTFQFLH